MNAVVAPEQQLTRRELRARRFTSDEPLDESFDLASAYSLPDVTPTEVLPMQTRRSRRRTAEAKPRAARTRAPHIAVLTSFGIATIAAPLTGFVTPEQSAQAIGVQVQTSVPLAETVSAVAAQSQLEGTVPSATALAANPNAVVIARDLSARTQTRTATMCTTIEGASGIREASVERIAPVYEPMAAGTYRNSSFFGPRWGSFHYGTDYAATLGTPIYAVTDGEVVVHAPNGQEGRSGNLLIIRSVIDGQEVWFWYGHMYDNGVYVKEGDTVTAGQVIGGIGNKGYSTGPHLHFEIHVGEWDNATDPLTWLQNAGATQPGSC